jgi:hypothetical protein
LWQAVKVLAYGSERELLAVRYYSGMKYHHTLSAAAY